MILGKVVPVLVIDFVISPVHLRHVVVFPLNVARYLSYWHGSLLQCTVHADNLLYLSDTITGHIIILLGYKSQSLWKILQLFIQVTIRLVDIN